MDDYNFLADLLATFRASPDVIKALWLIIPPGFVLCLLKLLLRWREKRGGLRLRRGGYFRQSLAEDFGSPRPQGARQDLLSHEDLSGIASV